MSITQDMMIALCDCHLRLPQINDLSQLGELLNTPYRLSGAPDNIYNFPHSRFGLSLAQATLMDPQLRQMIVVTQELLATYPTLPTEEIGLFVSSSNSSYLLDIIQDLLKNSPQDVNEALNNNDPNTYAAKIAYYLDIKGPAINCHGQCAGGLCALHLAMNALIAGDCNYAIVTAANLLDESSRNNPALGDGVIALLLTTLPIAIEQHLPCMSLLLGSGISSDGHDKSSYAAPSASAMIRAINRALETAELTKDQICYIEKAGSDMLLGREVEDEALAFYKQVPTGCGRYLFGDTNSVSGLLSLVKSSYQNLLEQMPNSYWAINSFGMGGCNVHLIAAPAPIELRSIPQAIKNHRDIGPICCYHSKPTNTVVTTTQQIDYDLIINNEIEKVLDYPFTTDMETATLSQLGLDSYIMIALWNKLETICGHQITGFRPDLTVTALKSLVKDQQSVAAEPIPEGYFKLFTIEYYDIIKNLFINLSLKERNSFPHPWHRNGQLLSRDEISWLTDNNKLVTILTYTAQNELIGVACFAENSFKLSYFQEKFNLNEHIIQDFYYLLPPWRNRRINLPSRYDFMEENGIDNLLMGRTIGSTLVAKQEIIYLQTRLLAVAMSSSPQEEEELFNSLLNKEPSAIKRFMQFPQNMAWQKKYTYLIEGNSFNNIPIKKLLSLTSADEDLQLLTNVVSDKLLFTLTSSRNRVLSGSFKYAGICFLQFEPLFIWQLD